MSRHFLFIPEHHDFPNCEKTPTPLPLPEKVTLHDKYS